jgi:hypothetical protein
MSKRRLAPDRPERRPRRKKTRHGSFRGVDSQAVCYLRPGGVQRVQRVFVRLGKSVGRECRSRSAFEGHLGEQGAVALFVCQRKWEEFWRAFDAEQVRAVRVCCLPGE